MGKTVGEINIIQGNIEVEWRINNFFSLIPNEDASYIFNSFIFNFMDASWYLRIDVFRKAEKDHGGYIGFYLMPSEINDPVTVTYNLNLKKANGAIEKECNYTNTFTEEDKGQGCTKFFKKSQLFYRMSDLVPSGVLTLSCSLVQETGKTIQRKLCTRGEKRLIEDIKELVAKEYYGDLKVTIRGKEFNLHKNILKVRTPTLAALIDDMLAKLSTDVVELDEFDEKTFRLFLDYVYSGTVDDLSVDNVFDLYELTEKYEVVELKEDCLTYIKENLTVVTFFKAYYLADKHDEKELLAFTSKFCSDNLKELMKDRSWITFMKENSVKAYEMLVTAFENYEKKD